MEEEWFYWFHYRISYFFQSFYSRWSVYRLVHKLFWQFVLCARNIVTYFLSCFLINVSIHIETFATLRYYHFNFNSSKAFDTFRTDCNYFYNCTTWKFYSSIVMFCPLSNARFCFTFTDLYVPLFLAFVYIFNENLFGIHYFSSQHRSLEINWKKCQKQHWKIETS